jgi:hypothetical protein
LRECFLWDFLPFLRERLLPPSMVAGCEIKQASPFPQIPVPPLLACFLPLRDCLRERLFPPNTIIYYQTKIIYNSISLNLQTKLFSVCESASCGTFYPFCGSVFYHPELLIHQKGWHFSKCQGIQEWGGGERFLLSLRAFFPCGIVCVSVFFLQIPLYINKRK